MTDTVTSQNIDLSSWGILYNHTVYVTEHLEWNRYINNGCPLFKYEQLIYL
jgi:hypothetical protein